ncbi:Helix-turn-helix domain-containing protein [Duganella sp. CF402]|uniref:helix-turn-helix domain-containing protein n=1 Tax=unclassified Duganella TaxID=2636909 RepID=UPI0008D7E4F6|nr:MULTISPECIES: helix-turn-helix domain-containing protein [unclassified Duganella]RZT11085.1 AraC family transcriptional regulator [Duganella sp. BK701]SEK82179.1 Helix-turn-helix domain-containing protein [Duganella sp. CF402]
MLHEEYPPPEELREAIKCFWHNRWDFGEQPGSFEVMPDGYAEIIFSFGSVMRDGAALPSPFLMGLLNQPVVFNAAGRLEIIGVRCYPWTVFDLLGLAPVNGVHTLEHLIAQLQLSLARYVQAGDIDAALGVLRRYFQPKQADSMLAKAGEAMRSAGGAMPVSEVAAAAHATVRTLERKFKQSSGHTVKDVSGLMRFEQARNRLWHAPQTNLAALAQELGYTDQSHLSREFKRYSGVAPSAFARKAKAQAESEGFVAFVQAPAGAKP